MAHLFRKTGTDVNDAADRIVRSWSCKHCGATKRRVTHKKVESPRPTIDQSVTTHECRRIGRLEMADYAKTHGAVGRADLPMFDPFAVKIIGLDVKVSPGDPLYVLYDPSVEIPIHPDFQKSIDDRGVDEPILVWKDGEDVYVLAGRDRTRASRAKAKKLGVEVKIPAIVKRGPIADVFRIFVEENAQRRDRDNPMVLARKIQNAEALGYDVKQIARMFRVAPATVEAHRELVGASKPLQRAVEQGHVGIGAASELLKLPEAKQPTALTKLLDAAPKGKKPKVHAAKKAVASEKGQVDVAKWRSKREVDRMIAALDDATTKGLDARVADIAEGALAVLKWVLGDDDSLAQWQVLLTARIDAEDAAKKERSERRKKAKEAAE